MVRWQHQKGSKDEQATQRPHGQSEAIFSQEGVHTEGCHQVEPGGEIRMVGSEETDRKGGQEDGLFMNLKGEEKEGERRIDLVLHGCVGQGEESNE